MSVQGGRNVDASKRVTQRFDLCCADRVGSNGEFTGIIQPGNLQRLDKIGGFFRFSAHLEFPAACNSFEGALQFDSQPSPGLIKYKLITEDSNNGTIINQTPFHFYRAYTGLDIYPFKGSDIFKEKEYSKGSCTSTRVEVLEEVKDSSPDFSLKEKDEQCLA